MVWFCFFGANPAQLSVAHFWIWVNRGSRGELGLFILLGSAPLLARWQPCPMTLLSRPQGSGTVHVGRQAWRCGATALLGPALPPPLGSPPTALQPAPPPHPLSHHCAERAWPLAQVQVHTSTHVLFHTHTHAHTHPRLSKHAQNSVCPSQGSKDHLHPWLLHSPVHLHQAPQTPAGAPAPGEGCPQPHLPTKVSTSLGGPGGRVQLVLV